MFVSVIPCDKFSLKELSCYAARFRFISLRCNVKMEVLLCINEEG